METELSTQIEPIRPTDNNSFPMPVDTLHLAIPTLVLLWLVAITTICGNILVISAWFLDDKVNSKPANVFILNLSLADLIIGLMSMPLNNIYLQYGYWPLGKLPCQIWMLIDYTVCLQAVFMIVFISMDRYWLVKKGLKYRTFQNNRKTWIMSLIGWLFSLIYFSFSCFIWPVLYEHTGTIDYNSECEFEIFDTFLFEMITLFIEFLIPLCLLIYFNSVVYKNIRNRSRGIKFFVRRRHSSNVSVIKIRQPNKSYAGKTKLVALKNDDEYLCTEDISTESTIQEQERTAAGEEMFEPKTFNITDKRRTRKVAENPPENSLVMNKHFQPKSHLHKTFVMLMALITVFLTCWLPYNVVIILQILCGCNYTALWEVVNILLWSNSMLNPILYAATNAQFRQFYFKTFLRKRIRF
ncbi:5-hydroxytryptamine receptor 1D-like [Antedon mediterranea]|uniref:5-hydroxytryptamine receptor 1D-like n=1 Tax=Antedon mediterranea TaxID=105859 RepID=UPI003AF839B9